MGRKHRMQTNRAEARFEALWRHRRHVLAAVRHKGADQQSAEDVVADAYLVAWRRMAHVPAEEGRARAWLFLTAFNLLGNLRRADRRRTSIVARLAASDLTRALREGEAPTPDRVHAASAWTAISDHDREILLQVSIDGLTPREMAESLDCSTGTAMTRLSRARARLADALAS